MGNKFLRIAVIYLLVGVTLGIFMAAEHNYQYRPVHAHLNLLGWASMALFGFFYLAVPAAGTTKLAITHFWIHNVALPIQMITLAMFLNESKIAEPILASASIAIGIGLICFAINLWRFTGAKRG